MRFGLLGPLTVVTDEGLSVTIRGRIRRAVLTCLLLEPNQVVSVDRLCGAVWGDAVPSAATASLHNHVMHVRRQLGSQAGARIRTESPGYLVEVRNAELDVEVFESLCAEGHQAALAQDWGQASVVFREALVLWRGDPCPDLVEAGTAASQVHGLSETRLAALVARIDAELRLGRHGELVAELRMLINEYPLREMLHELLMLALCQAGRRVEAMDAFLQLRKTLVDELGVEPSARMRDLYRRMLDADPTLDTSSETDVGPDSDSDSGPDAAQDQQPTAASTLPTSSIHFSGRARELRAICDHLAAAEREAHTVPMLVLSGLGGIGKSALAVRAAHTLSADYPDGQLFISLHGTSSVPRTAAEVLGNLLRELGVPNSDLPSDEEGRAARFRSLTSGRRLLIVLDDARDAAQVRPLLPGSGSCAVLVTSRRRLPGLVDAIPMHLDALAPAEALEVFTGIVGTGRVDAEPRATAQVLGYCGGLPLALRIAAARLASRPAWTVAMLATRLDGEHRRLDELRVEDLAVRASFQMSFSNLPGQPSSEPSAGGLTCAVAFRLLGLLPGYEFDVHVAAVLFDQSLEQAEDLLATLTDTSLVETTVPGRYRLHDLLRVFAVELSSAELTEQERDRTSRRLLSWYADALLAAVRLIGRSKRMPPGTEQAMGEPRWQVPEFAAHRDALAWCQAEEDHLIWALHTASAREWHDVVVRIASLMWFYYIVAGSHAPFATTQRLGADSALALGDEPAYAWLLTGLGSALKQAGDYEEAIDCFRSALTIRQRLGDERGLVSVQNNIASARYLQGRYDEALVWFGQAEAGVTAIGDLAALSIILNNAAETCNDMGDLPEAVAKYERSIKLCVQTRNVHQEGMARTGFGETLRRMGRLTDSLEQHRLALAIQDELGSDHRQLLTALDRLGATFADLGRVEDARHSWQEALALAERTADLRAAEIRARLESYN
ncbi:tetratricopeptide repeat protein [Catenulispora sp. NL8]|uniref:Tetratricopeptide repeat protein n=1 Tax=Catenulispora pinistramenti TaxID=2705254 RepID=A0ABS5KM59_9ACTN|nr:tetratricopeptide repeat protein [Catenulispora pinistramenti]